MKAGLPVAVRGHLRDVRKPGFARIDAQLFLGLVHQEIDRALDVGGGEGLAVMPFDTLAQRKGQLCPLLVPRPARRQVGDDRAQAVLLHVLLEHDEVVEHARHRPIDRLCRFLEHRHARRAVEVTEFENTARFLGVCRIGGAHRPRQPTCCREHAQFPLHPSASCSRTRTHRARGRLLPALYWALMRDDGVGNATTIRAGAIDAAETVTCRARRLPCASR